MKDNVARHAIDQLVRTLMRRKALTGVEADAILHLMENEETEKLVEDQIEEDKQNV